MELNSHDRVRFYSIIAGFDKKYRDVNALDGRVDEPMIRTAFYSACLKIVRDGPRLTSAPLQNALVEYYEHILDEEIKKIPEIERLIIDR